MANDSMKYDLNYVITEAIMSKTPVILIEGKDDIKFYNKIAESIKKEVEVFAIENIKEYSEGCQSVISCLENLQFKINEKPENIKYILGIIDRDARSYRNEIPHGLLGLFILKYYSYESHFITRKNLKYLVSHITGVTEGFIDEKTLDFIESDLNSEYEGLYYISLEALKNACLPGYNEVIGFSAHSGRVAEPKAKEQLLKEIMPKKVDLDDFAKEKGICINDVKVIAKGKWLLCTFSTNVYYKIKELVNECSKGTIKQCQYCVQGKTDKCLWKPSFSFQIDHVISLLLNYLDNDEINYIKEVFMKLGETAA